MCKSSSKWTEDVKVRPEAMKLLEGREALKAQRTEANADKWERAVNLKLLSSKGTNN